MNNVLSLFMACALMLIGAFASGCSGPKVDETKPIAEIQTEAEEMSAKELRRMAEAYREAITEKQDAVQDLHERLEDIDPDDLLSSDVTAIKADADALAKSIDALIERFDLYVRLLEQQEEDQEEAVTLD